MLQLFHNFRPVFRLDALKQTFEAIRNKQKRKKRNVATFTKKMVERLVEKIERSTEFTMCNNTASDPIDRMSFKYCCSSVGFNKLRKIPGRIMMNRQLTTYSNTLLLTRNQILQRRTVRNIQLLIKFYVSAFRHKIQLQTVAVFFSEPTCNEGDVFFLFSIKPYRLILFVFNPSPNSTRIK